MINHGSGKGLVPSVAALEHILTCMMNIHNQPWQTNHPSRFVPCCIVFCVSQRECFHFSGNYIIEFIHAILAIPGYYRHLSYYNIVKLTCVHGVGCMTRYMGRRKGNFSTRNWPWFRYSRSDFQTISYPQQNWRQLLLTLCFSYVTFAFPSDTIFLRHQWVNHPRNHALGHLRIPNLFSLP